MSRHSRGHRGHLKLLGTRHYTPQHAAGAAPETPPVRTLAALVAAPAPGLDVRPYGARPRGPMPYDVHPATQPIAAVPAHLAIEPVIEGAAA